MYNNILENKMFLLYRLSRGKILFFSPSLLYNILYKILNEIYFINLATGELLNNKSYKNIQIL